MSETEMKREIEAEEFMDELSDEAIDRGEGDKHNEFPACIVTVACR